MGLPAGRGGGALTAEGGQDSRGLPPCLETVADFLFFFFFPSFPPFLPGAVIRQLSLARLQRQVRVVNLSSPPLSQPPGKKEEEEEEEMGSGVSCRPGPGRASLGRG